MLLSNRRTFLLSALALAGCGFTPVHGPQGSANLRNAVMVQAPTNRDEFELVRALEQRFGQPRETLYTLSYKLTVSEEAVVVSNAQGQERFNVTGRLDFSLADNDGTVQAKGVSKAFTSYSSTGSTVATDQAQRDAHDRLMIILADQTLTRLAAELAS